MRERITLSLVAITLVLLGGASVLRSFAVEAEVREHKGRDVATTAEILRASVSDELREGASVDPALLEPFAGPGVRIEYAEPGAAPVVLTGKDYDPSSRTKVAATVVAGDASITVTQAHADDEHIAWEDPRGGLALAALTALLTGALAFLVARNISGPFRRLATAAAALGRGRFDLDLPEGGVPEARAISWALEGSAEQLQERLRREREFGLHASHVLRTPLTGLRIRLEEMIHDPAVPDEIRAEAESCLRAVDQLNDGAAELVALSGRGVLVAGAALPLRDLAAQVAQRWADQLDVAGRRLTAGVEGDLDLVVTPGPVEQALDVLLDDVVAHGRGPVRLEFEGADARLRVDVRCAGLGTGGYDAVRAVLEPLGARLEAGSDAGLVSVHLAAR